MRRPGNPAAKGAPTTIAVDGVTVRVRGAGGAGPTALLIHSSGMSSRQWLRLSLELEGRGVAWLAPDLWGYGATPPLPDGRPDPIAADVALVCAVLEHAPEPVVIVGHSYGGFLALRATMLRPDRVRAVVVHEPVAWGALHAVDRTATTRAFEDINHDGLFFDAAKGGGAEWFSRFVEFWMGEGAWDRLSARQRHSFLATGKKTFLEVMALCKDTTPPEHYAQIKVPTVVSVGRESPALERRVCAIIAESVASGRLVELPGGHMAPLTHGEDFRELVFAVM